MAIDFTSSPYYEATVAPVTGFPLTLSVWYNPDNTSTTQGLFGLFDASSAVDWMMINQRTSGRTSAYIRTASMNVQADSPSTLSAGTWYHVCCTFDSSSRFCYLDGTAGTEETTAGSAPSALDTTSLGRYGDSSPGAAANAQIGEAAMWNVVLSADEISALAGGTPAIQVRPSALQAYYPAIDTTMGAKDVVGGNDLTVTGSPGAAEHPPIVRSQAIMVERVAAAAAGQSPMIITPWRREPAHLLRL